MKQQKTSLVIRQPDDWHIHLRDGDALKETCKSVARYFSRAIVMPNLTPPVTTVEQALAYRERILANTPDTSNFQPLMTLYLTENTKLEEIRKAAENPHVYACKLYPSGATTNSDAGVGDVKKVYHLFEAMQKYQLPLLIHGEVTHQHTDIFEREKCFIDEVFVDIRQQFPELKSVFEHITTQDAVDFVKDSSDNIAATLTIHHLLYNRNDLLAGGIKPHYYCLPILKKNRHQEALIQAAISGNKKFFLGTDSAPHARNQKESACGCAGIYSAPAAIELYAELFEKHQALDKLEAFASEFGADFYQVEKNKHFIRLTKETWTMEKSFPMAGEELVPICAGEAIHWKVDSDLLSERP